MSTVSQSEHPFGRVRPFCAWAYARRARLRDHAKSEGLTGVKNGRLLSLARDRFDVLITADQNLRFQQNLAGFNIAVLELSTNNLRRLRAAQEQVLTTLKSIQPGQVVRLDIP